MAPYFTAISQASSIDFPGMARAVWCNKDFLGHPPLFGRFFRHTSFNQIGSGSQGNCDHQGSPSVTGYGFWQGEKGSYLNLGIVGEFVEEGFKD